MKTCPCKIYPFEPQFYIAKLGYVGVYLFVIFLLQNIDSWYSLPTIYVLSKNKKRYQFFSAENVQFLKLKKSLFIAWASFRNDNANRLGIQSAVTYVDYCSDTIIMFDSTYMEALQFYQTKSER